MGRAYVGISGWVYPTWRGVYYPAGVTHKRELAYASRRMPSIEVNGSFYSLLRPTACDAWREETPPGFVFAVKGSRYITHMLKLTKAETPLANFFASGILALGDKLGPILWQLPPHLGFDAARLAAFFDLLPRTMRDAAKLARKHDERLRGRAFTRAIADGRIRHAIEVRHPSFGTPALVALLRKHDVALTVADSAGTWPHFEDVTSDFVYVRLHGDSELYASRYELAALERWAARVDRWRDGGEPDDATLIDPAHRAPRVRSRDVYVYFDNDARCHAPFDAEKLVELTGGVRAPTRPDLEGAGEPPRSIWPQWEGAPARAKGPARLRAEVSARARASAKGRSTRSARPKGRSSLRG